MTATAASADDANRRTAIANLLLPTSDIADQKLLSLSHLAATMQPAATGTPSSHHSRDRDRDHQREREHREHQHREHQHREHQHREHQQREHQQREHQHREHQHREHQHREHQHREHQQREIQHREHQHREHQHREHQHREREQREREHRERDSRDRFSRTRSVPAIRRDALPDRAPASLGIQRPSQKRISRRGSGLTPGRRAAFRRELNDDTSDCASPAGAVLRPISANPIAHHTSKHTSASNSIESCMPDDAVSPAKKEAFQLAAQRFSSADFASNVLASPRDAEAMDVDVEYEQREPSSSSHDAKVARQNRARTTPDAKRAQNRESAKRFRVAQKKRWAELQETVERKDAEIERLKNMLQEVTTQHLASANQDQAPPAVSSEKVDSITLCELNMFVQLMVSRRDDTRGSSSHSGNRLTMPLVSGIGGLHRVVVSRLDGSVLGVRHKNNLLGEVMGGEVGGLVWDYVHVTDVAHLRFTVVHASRMASSLLKSEPNVFSYRRRKRVHESSGENEEQFLRMNGCVYPLAEENGEIKTVLFAEFIEM